MSKSQGNVPNRLGLNYGAKASKASKVNENPTLPAQKMQDKIKELERRLEEQFSQSEKMQDNIEGLERRLEEQFNQSEKMQDQIKVLERHLEERCNQNESIEKTRDQKSEYCNSQTKKLGETVKKLATLALQLKNRIDEDSQRQNREREAQDKIQDVQSAMQKILATIMEQQHKHISDMIEFQIQLPASIRGE
ncbi:hypothetical protein BCIN_12g01210 [Botrytis cinerea B05.10]|uniref:Uncharacterized protein n=1 Tax=Botryotinia fuckeliana (strain B05.10) TaxID=332648 RepID=A0A384JYD4_BOTFB|nr:hypothetical protein BCIN_12g01210 [Botrytis cinerea B05.10]XP_024552039.1 hypothetical protein BCIN_12g01210 [Botrytis cinerea B05.10]ATZ55532.1 hypothetical protein BCIN_12g01210 [Botrytis cinerea B05.10]ATZ55533.1 hypothetical protein BCIN_12g01210 [Botrytis cinerea B05.10]